eukprot:1763200-Amphidinium_carterae.1
MIVWCASLGYVNVAGRKLSIPSEATSAETTALLGHEGNLRANHIFGIVRLTQVSAYDLLKVYSQGAELQLEFWRHIVGNHVKQYVFDVGETWGLPEAVPLMEISDRKLRGFFVTLEAGQAERLWSSVPDGLRALSAVVPELALRVPPQYAELLIRKLFDVVAIPHMERESKKGRGGSQTLHINWQLLPQELSQPPLPPQYDTSLPQHLELTKDSAKEVANLLKGLASEACSAATAAIDDDELEMRRLNLLQLVHLMTLVAEELDPHHFQGLCRDMRQRARLIAAHGDSIPHRRVKYNVIWLIQVMIMSDCLRDASNLQPVILMSLRMVLPSSLHSIIQSTLSDQNIMTPDPSTLSRWRLLLDGAFMIYRRAELSENHLRWMMSDSSTQHGRSFQLTSVLSLCKSDAGRALRAANELVHLWFRPLCANPSHSVAPQKFEKEISNIANVNKM